jgi:dTDP-4-dehydrorhamnose reductase
MVLITGASGSLGWVLAEKLAPNCEVIACYYSNPDVPGGTLGVRLDLSEGSVSPDLPQQGSLDGLFLKHKPEVVFHLAAWTAPDRCEESPEEAMKVNFEATRELASLARDAGSRLVFVSTDLVFDGTRGNYGEEDSASPLSIYGDSKLRAEKAVLETCDGAVVVRTSLIYGPGSGIRRTFLSNVVENLRAGKPMKLFTDQKRNPIWTEDLARSLIDSVRLDLAGLYHIGGSEVVTRYEFGQMVCRAFGYDETLLSPTKMEDFDYLAKRPLDSTLDTGKFEAATGFIPTPVEAVMKELRRRQMS